MRKCISRSQIDGQVKAPPSKSLTQRALAAGLLCNGSTRITNPSMSDDAVAAMKVAEELGAETSVQEGMVIIKGGLNPSGELLDCGESGLCLRMFTPIAALLDRPIELTGRGSLLSRPVSMLEDPLRELGVYCRTNRGFPPITVKGPLAGGTAGIDCSVSSQGLTGFLMALPVAKSNSTLTVKDLRSKPYIDMTLQILEGFRVRIACSGHEKYYIEGNQKFESCEYEVEGDWSGASFILVAGAIGGRVKVTGLRHDSKQADRRIVEVLRTTGAKVAVSDGVIEVARGELKPFEFDAADCPDLFPPLAALASCCNGVSRIRGVGRLAYKESNRALTLEREFKSLGASVRITGDAMEIAGGMGLKGGRVSSHNDHRLAMAFAVAAIAAEGDIVIEGSECVSKSYPDFFESMIEIGGKVYE
jgi:3-phosphoshikimate 1-carboxyvinyltransferase